MLGHGEQRSHSASLALSVGTGPAADLLPRFAVNRHNLAGDDEQTTERRQRRTRATNAAASRFAEPRDYSLKTTKAGVDMQSRTITQDNRAVKRQARLQSLAQSEALRVALELAIVDGLRLLDHRCVGFGHDVKAVTASGSAALASAQPSTLPNVAVMLNTTAANAIGFVLIGFAMTLEHKVKVSVTGRTLLTERKNPLPIVLHADDRPAASRGFIQAAVEPAEG